MGTYHAVVVRDSAGEFCARIDPEDFGYGNRRRSIEPFTAQILPAILTATEAHFGTALEPIWIDDMSGDGWNLDPDREVPWDGPASLWDEPTLPYLVPASRPETHYRPPGRAESPLIVLANL